MVLSYHSTVEVEGTIGLKRPRSFADAFKNSMRLQIGNVKKTEVVVGTHRDVVVEVEGKRLKRKKKEEVEKIFHMQHKTRR